MTLKIERVFEKNKQNCESKTGQKGHEFSNQKGPQQMQKFLHVISILFYTGRLVTKYQHKLVILNKVCL